MGSLKNRLQRLEAGEADGGATQEIDRASRAAFTVHIHAIENARRELLGESRREPTDEEKAALEEVAHGSVEPVRPPWYSAAAWEERERRFRDLFAELRRCGEAIHRKDTR